MGWKLKDIEDKIKKGTVQGYKETIPQKKGKQQEANGRIVTKVYSTASKGKTEITKTLLEFSQSKGLILKQEFRFHPTRRWRFDWCIESLKLAVEYDGQIPGNVGAHSGFRMLNKDIEKNNAAQQLGWTVLRFSYQNYTTITEELRVFLNNKNKLDNETS